MGYKKVAIVLSLAALLSLPLAGQIATGSIKGTVLDPAGAAVPNAQVQARNIGTSIVTAGTTTAEGSFTLVNLPAGTYEVSAEAQGFKRTVVTGVLVDIAVTTRVDVRLTLGSISESVEVVGAAPVITPDSAEAGTVLTSTEYENLPLSTGGRVRDPMSFVPLTPGVNAAKGGGIDTSEGHISVNGGQPWTTDVLVDGMSAGQVSHFGSWNEMAPPVDAFGEFKIITGGGFSAEYGHVGTAVVNYSLKSGTNNYHGSLFEFFRNTELNARSFFQKQRSPYHQNDFGGTVDGPVWIPHVYNGENRTFFMASLDTSFYRGIDVTQLYTSPTSAMLTGDFSSLKTATGQPVIIYDPATTASNPQGGVFRTPFAGNAIPPARFSAAAQAIVSLFPLPNLPGNINNFSGIGNGGSNAGGCPVMNNYMFVTKVDHHFSDKQTVSFSTTYTFLPRQCDGGNPYVDTPLANGSPPRQDFSTHQFRLTYNYIFSPKVLNTVELGYNRFLNPAYTFSRGQDWPAKLGISGLDGSDGSMPKIDFSSDGYPSLSATFAMRDVEKSAMVRDTVTILRGRHNLRVGFDYRTQGVVKRRNNNGIGDFVFNSKETGLNASAATGNAFASFLLGAADSETVGSSVDYESQLPYYAWFLQDDIKASSKLTLNLGLRYDLELPPVERHDESSTFDLNTPNPGAGNVLGAYIFAGSGPGHANTRTFTDTYYKAFGPRVGFAYALTPGTVIRAGYGISYSTNEQLITNDGWSTTATFISPDNGNTPLYLQNGVPTNWPQPPLLVPTFGNGNNVTYYAPDAAHSPTVQNWRFDVQRELPWKTVLEVAYVGTHGSHLAGSGLANLNQVNSQYLALGSLLTANISSAAARAAGIAIPYPGFTGTVAQALRPYPQVRTITDSQAKLGWSTYEAFQLRLQKRFSRGVQGLLSYTNSKLLTNMQQTTTVSSVSQLQDTANLQAERAVAVFDIPQMFWMEMIYELPLGPGKPLLSKGGVLGKLVGGWSLSPILNYASGQPLTIGQNNQLAIFNYGQRPNVVPGVAVRNDVGYGAFDPATERLFNPSAFQSPGTAAFGNSAARLSYARNYGTRMENLSLRKDTRIKEGVSLEFNAQVFNLFNRPQWGNANSTYGNANFGTISTTGAGRFVQLGMKLHF